MDIVWFKVFKTTSFSIPTTNDLYAIVSEHVLTSGIIYFFFYNEIYLLGNHYIRYVLRPFQFVISNTDTS